MNAMELQRLIFTLLLTICVARILDWRGPNHKSHAMTSSQIFKRENVYGTKISKIFLCNKEDEKLWPGWPKVKKSKCLNWEMC